MASRPTTRCSRAVKHIRAPTDHVWITDSILASAFERYCHVSRPSRRLSSSTPGPLENRRRLGKRRMTGLYSNEFQPTLPPWMVEFPVDFTQWKWKPPTTADARKKEMEAESAQLGRGLLSKLQRFFHLEEVAEDMDWDDLKTVADASEDISERFSKALDVLEKSSGKLDAEFLEVMGALERDIFLGSIAANAIPDMVVSFMGALEKREWLRKNKHECGIVAEAASSFWSAMIEGLATSRVQGFEQVDLAGINSILVELSKLPSDRHKIAIFQKIMLAVPDTFTLHLATGLEAILRSLFQNIHKYFGLVISSAVASLDTINPGQDGHSELLARLEGFVVAASLQQPDASGFHRREAWLTILARLPHVGDEYLLDAISRLDHIGGEWTPMKERRTCILLIQQWQSQGLLDSLSLVKSPWRWATKRSPETSLAALLWHINAAKLGRPLESDYLQAIRKLGLTKEFLASFRAWSAARPDNSALSVPALKMIRSQDHALSIELCQLMAVHRNGFQRVEGLDWTCESWTTMVKDMIYDPRVHPGVVWSLFHATVVVDDQERRRKHQFTRVMATWFSHARHLSDRDMFRHVSRCNAWLRAEGEMPRGEALLALARVCARLLWRGEPGRASQADFVVAVIRNDLGEDQARKLARLLLKWRKRNHNDWLVSGSGL